MYFVSSLSDYGVLTCTSYALSLPSFIGPFIHEEPAR